MLAILFAAAVCDIRHRTIPNVLAAASLPMGLAFQILAPLKPDPYSMACLAPVFAFLLLFWHRGKIGGGDIKLCFAIAVMYPTETGLSLIALSFAAALAVGILYRVFAKKTEYPLAPGMLLAAVLKMTIQGGLI